MNSKVKLPAAMGALLTIIFSTQACGDQAAIMARVYLYSESMAQFESGKSKKTLGEIYAEGRAVGKGLAAVLESLNANDYALAQNEMKGFFVFREEIVGVEPKMMFFHELAKRKGSKEDIDFFRFMVELYGAGIWPAYIEQQTDYSGCGRYGDGTRTRLYLDATSITTPANETYRTELGEVVNELKESLVSDDSCVCGGPDSVIKELTLFVEKAPDSSAHGDAANLLAKVKAGKSKMRFSCRTG